MQKIKVKIFTSQYLQQEINQWFSQNPDIKIIDITQSSSDHRVTVSVFYKDE